MSILWAILLLAILVVVHELGHFLAARLMKIEVREFSVGFGPKLFGWKSRKYETTFAVRAIPLGGYCAFYGEDDVTGESRDDPRAFPKQNVWKRLLVILMGPAMNFVLAFLVAAAFYWTNGIQDREFFGAGIYADVTLRLDGKQILVRINEREIDAVPYRADPNAHEDRIVETDGFFCRDGRITSLRFDEGERRDMRLTAQLEADDGNVRTVIFHTASEESLYLDGDF